jgi:hypothetical protein
VSESLFDRHDFPEEPFCDDILIDNYQKYFDLALLHGYKHVLSLQFKRDRE